MVKTLEHPGPDIDTNCQPIHVGKEDPLFSGGGSGLLRGASPGPEKYTEIGAYCGPSVAAGRPTDRFPRTVSPGSLSKRGRNTPPITRKRPISILPVLYLIS